MNELRKGTRIKLISAPEWYNDDIGKCGTVDKVYTNYAGKECVDYTLDGDNGLSACYTSQVVKV